MNDLERFEADIKLSITGEAFDESDFLDALMDMFSSGEECGIRIDSCEVLSHGPSERV